jgi:hypothetical protein
VITSQKFSHVEGALRNLEKYVLISGKMCRKLVGWISVVSKGSQHTLFFFLKACVCGNYPLS